MEGACRHTKNLPKKKPNHIYLRLPKPILSSSTCLYAAYVAMANVVFFFSTKN